MRFCLGKREPRASPQPTSRRETRHGVGEVASPLGMPTERSLAPLQRGVHGQWLMVRSSLGGELARSPVEAPASPDLPRPRWPPSSDLLIVGQAPRVSFAPAFPLSEWRFLSYKRLAAFLSLFFKAVDSGVAACADACPFRQHGLAATLAREARTHGLAFLTTLRVLAQDCERHLQHRSQAKASSSLASF